MQGWRKEHAGGQQQELPSHDAAPTAPAPQDGPVMDAAAAAAINHFLEIAEARKLRLSDVFRSISSDSGAGKGGRPAKLSVKALSRALLRHGASPPDPPQRAVLPFVIASLSSCPAFNEAVPRARRCPMRPTHDHLLLWSCPANTCAGVPQAEALRAAKGVIGALRGTATASDNGLTMASFLSTMRAMQHTRRTLTHTPRKSSRRKPSRHGVRAPLTRACPALPRKRLSTVIVFWWVCDSLAHDHRT